MITNDNFAIFILSHMRAEKVITYKTLIKANYTGKIYIIIDNEDEQKNLYLKKFGDKVIIFDKEKYLSLSDTMDCGGNRNIVLPARNACFDIAKSLKLDYFFEADDDYFDFEYRYPVKNVILKTKSINDRLKSVFELFADFLDTDERIKTVCFAQGGDFIGGVGNYLKKSLINRKAMNCYLCKTSRPFKFIGRINEDTNLYTQRGIKGDLFFTVRLVSVVQTPTQQSKGGLTDIYLELGTYQKSFYSVIGAPGAVKVSAMGDHYKRIHHSVNWDNCVPCILSSTYKK